MKKNIIAIICAIMLSFVSTIAFAGTTTAQTKAGDPITVDGSTNTCAGPNLSFTPSSSTLISATTSDTEYTVTSASSKTTKATGMEFGIDSSSNAMYQKQQAVDNAITDTDSAAILPTPANWKNKAGNTAPTS